MGKKITPSNNLLIAMDSRGTCVAGQLPYDNNMLYLPLPDISECMASSGSINVDKNDIAPVEERDPARTCEHLDW